ncbi:DUF4064 domain-containing protein [Halobacillus litoralis]|uniref:DUF4064 domain-containing protein n=1 Tax=Halobacillus litoralis TaxID=45668 RepID=UPI001CD50DF1|nr:DUF4064 domain-containing protein [Halobacillus litoralis]MCA0972521.1 DUF4064 domain-containing protein [Halobacillus litoralis]
MKRTVEIVITVIGIILYGFPLIIGFFFQSFQNNPQAREDFMAAMQEAPNGQDLEGINMDEMFNFLGTFTMVIIVASLIAIGLAILSIVFLKGNKKPKAAGIILIITAVVFALATVFFGLFGSVAFLIAGIVALVRKPPKPTDEEAITY